MKLATYSDGSRDGQLLVVSRDLESAHYATGIAHRMQQALDDWNFIAPQLQDLYETLNHGKARHAFPFDAARCMAPLPRAYQRLSGVDLQPCPSDALLGARSPIRPASPHGNWISFETGLAVITGDVPLGATPEQGQDAIRLLTLANTFDLDPETQEESNANAAALGPVAVTPDELGAAWQGARVHLALSVAVNGHQLEPIDMGKMYDSFDGLIAMAARLHPLTAGTIVGMALHTDYRMSGAINLKCERPDESGEALQSLRAGAGDTVRIEVKDASGQSVFGAIEQTVELP
jgi:fumarylacetoacetate (FAA) hydrolase